MVINKKSRDKIFSRDSYRCQYCGGVFKNEELHIDHIMPLSKGGKNNEMNLTTSCIRCNLYKGNLSYSEFIEKAILKYQHYKMLSDYFASVVIIMSKGNEK